MRGEGESMRWVREGREKVAMGEGGAGEGKSMRWVREGREKVAMGEGEQGRGREGMEKNRRQLEDAFILLCKKETLTCQIFLEIQQVLQQSQS